MKAIARAFVIALQLPLVSALPAQIPDTVILQLKSEIPFAGLGLPQKVLQDQPGRPYCYIAAKEGGLRIYKTDDISNPVFKKNIPVGSLEGQEVMNIWQEGNYLYLALGNFFNGNSKAGLAIVDVASPENAFVTDTWLQDTPDKGCAFVTVSGNYAYLGAMTQGLILLDVGNKNDISFVSQYIPDINFPVPNPNSIQMPNARGMAVRGNEVFLCYDAGGLRVIDVSDKWHPVETGRYINPDALGKQQAYNNIALNGDTAYVAVDFCGLEILDIADTGNIAPVSWWNPWDCQSPGNTWVNSPGHCNQIDFDAVGRFVFLSTGRSELNIVDVGDPLHPRQVGSYGSPTDNYFAWGVTQTGHRVYLAYISSLFPFFSIWAGVRILEWEKTTGVGEAPSVYSANVYPNPFSGQVNFEFSLNQKSELQIQIFDLQGNRVENVAGGVFEAGKHSLAAGVSLPAGMYLLRINAPSGTMSRKLVKF